MAYRRSFDKREKPEFDQKIIDVRRVARVVAGGRRFSFRVTVVAGNRKGEVGVGLGKGADTSLAIEKAGRSAKKERIKILLTKTNSIPHEIISKFSTARVMMRPAKKGHGLVAGSAIRTVLELAGVNDVTAKIFSKSKNKLNIARAAIKALSSFDKKFTVSPVKVKEVAVLITKKTLVKKNKKIESDKKGGDKVKENKHDAT